MIPTGSIATMLCLASSAAGTQHERWIGHRFTWQHYGRTWWTSTARLWLWATTALLPGFVSLFLWNPAIVRCLTFALTGRGERMRAGGPVGRVVQRFACASRFAYHTEGFIRNTQDTSRVLKLTNRLCDHPPDRFALGRRGLGKHDADARRSGWAL